LNNSLVFAALHAGGKLLAIGEGEAVNAIVRRGEPVNERHGTAKNCAANRMMSGLSDTATEVVCCVPK